jgi:hypothetical protein
MVSDEDADMAALGGATAVTGNAELSDEQPFEFVTNTEYDPEVFAV